MLNRVRQSQFHEAVLRQLYPQHPQDENPSDEVQPEQSINIPEIVENVPSEDDLNTNMSDLPSDSGESGSNHLTRAQRKRIRKRKLKEVASSSKKFVGPLLPAKPLLKAFSVEALKCIDVEGCGFQSESGCNISDRVSTLPNSPKRIDSSAMTFHMKLKRRRLSKRLSQEPDKSMQREQPGRAFTAESCGGQFVLKHVE